MITANQHNMKNKTDNELIRIYREGNVIGFNELLERYQAKVYGYIFSLVKDADKANEIFQETFYKVIKTIYSDQYNYEGKFAPWVMRIAHSLIFEHFEKEKNKTC